MTAAEPITRLETEHEDELDLAVSPEWTGVRSAARLVTESETEPPPPMPYSSLVEKLYESVHEAERDRDAWRAKARADEADIGVLVGSASIALHRAAATDRALTESLRDNNLKLEALRACRVLEMLAAQSGVRHEPRRWHAVILTKAMEETSKTIRTYAQAFAILVQPFEPEPYDGEVLLRSALMARVYFNDFEREAA